MERYVIDHRYAAAAGSMLLCIARCTQPCITLENNFPRSLPPSNIHDAQEMIVQHLTIYLDGDSHHLRYPVTHHGVGIVDIWRDVVGNL